MYKIGQLFLVIGEDDKKTVVCLMEINKKTINILLNVVKKVVNFTVELTMLTSILEMKNLNHILSLFHSRTTI